jgi:transposase
LYLNPPEHAAVFAVDEKSAIQALDRLDPVLPLSPGRAERHGFEYYRHGTLSLYAALNTRSGQVLGKTTLRHTSIEFVEFLGQIIASQPKEKEIHVIADNLSAHKTKEVSAFLLANPNVRIYYTSTYSSWLNQVEIWFSKFNAKSSLGASLATSRIWHARSCDSSATITRLPHLSAGVTRTKNNVYHLLYESQIRCTSFLGIRVPIDDLGLRHPNKLLA